MIKDNKKVGLCLAYSGTNYGQNLQAFATQQVIEDMGYSTEIIEYRSGSNKGLKMSWATLCVSVSATKKKLKKKLSSKKKLDEVHRINDKKRKEKADLFRKERLHNFVSCNGIDELRNKSKEYFAVLVGSDQIWLPNIAVSNFYTLRFAAPGVRRISYATSMGVSSYPNYAKKPAADFLSKIDYLSVREEKAKELIASFGDIDAKVVCDPTYLLTKEQWEEKIPSEKVTEDGYILCYFLGHSEDQKAYAKEYAERKGLRIVSILSNECESSDNFADEIITGKGPEDFVNLIRNSEYVMTDSFHGLAFSVINEKQFYIFYRVRTDVKESRNSRIDNIVKTWGVEDRLIKNPEKMEFSDTEIDYSKVSDIREGFRKESLEFLSNALGAE